MCDRATEVLESLGRNCWLELGIGEVLAIEGSMQPFRPLFFVGVETKQCSSVVANTWVRRQISIFDLYFKAQQNKNGGLNTLDLRMSLHAQIVKEGVISSSEYRSL